MRQLAMKCGTSSRCSAALSVAFSSWLPSTAKIGIAAPAGRPLQPRATSGERGAERSTKRHNGRTRFAEMRRTRSSRVRPSE